MALIIDTDEEWTAVQRLLKEMRSGAVSSGADSREQAVVFWRRKENKVRCLINELDGNWNLSEHPEKMNGFANIDDIVERILSEFGLSKPKDA